MRPDELIVEVRDNTLARVGVIQPKELDLSVTALFNNVGEWTLSLPVEHPLATELRTPGSGIIVSGPQGVILSGPTTAPEAATTADDPRGTVQFTGVGDGILLLDALAWPDPASGDVTAQAYAYDTRNGVAETLMHDYVRVNIGPDAPEGRRNVRLTMGPDLGRGSTVSKQARFPTLGDLLTEIATPDRLGFRVVQRGRSLVFETYVPADRSREVRLTVENGEITGQKIATAAPGVTRVIVAGKGQLVDRTFIERTSDLSLAAETQWGRRIERFVDQRQTSNADELNQAGDEVLADEGVAAVGVQVTPAESSSMRFGTDWGLGDVVSVVVDGQELSSNVTGVIVLANTDGVRVGAQLGDPTGFDTSADLRMQKRLIDAEQRLSALERVESPADPSTGGGSRTVSFQFATATTSWLLPHNLDHPAPTVVTRDSSGAEIYGDVVFVDANTARVDWYFPTSGSAHVSD